MYSDAHLIQIYNCETTEIGVPVEAFLAKTIIAFKKSLAISDEQNEIIAMLMSHQSSMILLTMSLLTDTDELTDLAKEIFRN